MALSLTPSEIIQKKTYPLLVKADSWERVFLKDVAEVQNGYAFKSSYFSHTVGMPLIRIRDINRTKTEHLYSDDYEDAFVVKRGDILIGMDGDFNTAIWKGENGLLNQRVCRINTPTSLFERKFLFLCLQPYLNAINAETSSVTVKHLSSRTIGDIPLPLPPINEQTRIVEKIEELFSELDKGVESLKTARQQLKVYRQALLKQAFEGKLTEQWRADNPDKVESAAQLLARIKTEREARHQQQLEEWKQAVKEWEAAGKEGKKPAKPKKLKEFPPVSEEELAKLPKLPEKWGWTRFGNTALESVLGKMLDKSKNKGIFKPYLRNINVRWGAINLDDLLEMRFEDSEKDRYSLKKGDLVICEGGEPGRCAVWKNDGDIRIQKALHRVRVPENHIKSEFMYYQMLTFSFTGLLARFFTGTTIKHLTGQGLENSFSVICSPSEQVEIVSILDGKLSILERLESDIQTNLQKSEALRQSILKKAFSGQLVSQNPDDEPASELLARIKDERKAAELAAQEAKKTIRKTVKKRGRKTKAA